MAPGKSSQSPETSSNTLNRQKIKHWKVMDNVVAVTWNEQTKYQKQYVRWVYPSKWMKSYLLSSTVECTLQHHTIKNLTWKQGNSCHAQMLELLYSICQNSLGAKPTLFNQFYCSVSGHSAQKSIFCIVSVNSFLFNLFLTIEFYCSCGLISIISVMNVQCQLNNLLCKQKKLKVASQQFKYLYSGRFIYSFKIPTISPTSIV